MAGSTDAFNADQLLQVFDRLGNTYSMWQSLRSACCKSKTVRDSVTAFYAKFDEEYNMDIELARSLVQITGLMLDYAPLQNTFRCMFDSLLSEHFSIEPAPMASVLPSSSTLVHVCNDTSSFVSIDPIKLPPEFLKSQFSLLIFELVNLRLNAKRASQTAERQKLPTETLNLTSTSQTRNNEYFSGWAIMRVRAKVLNASSASILPHKKEQMLKLIDEIATSENVSHFPGNFYHNFVSRNAAFLEIYDEQSSRIQSLLAPAEMAKKRNTTLSSALTQLANDATALKFRNLFASNFADDIISNVYELILLQRIKADQKAILRKHEMHPNIQSVALRQKSGIACSNSSPKRLRLDPAYAGSSSTPASSNQNLKLQIIDDLMSSQDE